MNDRMLNPGSALSRVLVDELARGGVREAVIAPGSRSAALAVAFARHPGIRLHVRIDERSAAFLALGLSKVSGQPVAVVCTSGTAAANFHPAVVEAAHSRTPLVVLTADRPPELRGTGVNQTIDQAKLYGEAACFFTELAVAEPRAGMNAYWRSVVCRGLAAARSNGPIHLNVPFRVPLLSDPLSDPVDSDWPDSLEGRCDGQPWTSVPAVTTATTLVPELADPPERGVLVVADGADDPDRAVAFAESVGWPVLAEPTSNARHGSNAITTYAHLLASKELSGRLRPELIVTIGRPALVRQLLALYPKVPHLVVSTARHWPDPTRTATRVVGRLPAGVSCRDRARTGSGWIQMWRTYESVARRALDAALDRTPERSELRLARDLAAFAGPDGLLFVGSSLPIRHLDLTMTTGPNPRVLANRGVSGIDGCVSAAVGTALAHQRQGGGPAFALLGDLTLVHDQNGLVIGPGEPRPDLTVVVVNNDGGGIFEHMSFRNLGADFERLFGTPHGVDFSHVAAATGWEYRQVHSAADLPGALKGIGTRLVEVRTDRGAGAAHLRETKSAVAEAVLTAFDK
jgi:2-succinyl-5-enolpyruvyl-6-hydroxy-3-cyclohexene-1-carboxylate synthase